MGNIEVIQDFSLSSRYEKRYIIVDKDTKVVLDNAQGYGYKSIQKAYAAYAYKNRDKSKDKEKKEKEKKIRNWFKEHSDFNGLLEAYAFEIAKGSGDPSEKFDAALVSRLLKENNLTVDFSASELLKVWKKI